MRWCAIMPLSDILLFAFALAPIAYADVRFDVPGPGVVVPGGADFKVEWSESGVAPSINELGEYSIALYSGSNDEPVSTTLLEFCPLGGLGLLIRGVDTIINPRPIGELCRDAE
jgi:hypothetical protein